MKRFRAGTRRTTAYLRLLRQLSLDSLWRFKGLSFTVVAGETVAFACQIGALALVLQYASSLEHGKTVIVPLLGWSYEVRSSTTILAATALGVLTLLLLSAVLAYVGGRSRTMLRRRYEVFASKRALQQLSASNLVWTPADRDCAALGDITKIVRRDTRYAGRVAVALAGGIVPLLVFFVCLAVVVWMDWSLTLVFLSFMFVAAFFLYRTSVKAAQASKAMENSSTEAGKVFRDVVRRILLAEPPLTEDLEWIEQKAFQQGPVRDNFLAYGRRLMSIVEATFVTNCLFAVAIFLLMAVYGTRVLLGTEAWDALVIYFVALRYCLINLRGLGQRITGINRFYPQLRRYFDFIRTTRRVSVDEETPSRLVLQATNELLSGSERVREMASGARVAVVCNLELSRLTLPRLSSSLAGRSQAKTRAFLAGASFVTERYGWIPDTTVLEGLDFEDEGVEDVLAHLEELGIARDSELLSGVDWSAPLGLQAWNRLDPRIKFALAAVRVARDGRPWIFVEARGLHSLPRESQAAVLAHFADRLLFIIYSQGLERVGSCGEEVVAVLHKGEIVGLGTPAWHATQQDEVARLIRPDTNADTDDRLDLVEDDDDED